MYSYKLSALNSHTSILLSVITSSSFNPSLAKSLARTCLYHFVRRLVNVSKVSCASWLLKWVVTSSNNPKQEKKQNLDRKLIKSLIVTIDFASAIWGCSFVKNSLMVATLYMCRRICKTLSKSTLNFPFKLWKDIPKNSGLMSSVLEIIKTRKAMIYAKTMNCFD